jgi:hypothetical protein
MPSSLTPAQYRAVWDALESLAGLSASDRRRELRHRFVSDPACLREALALLDAEEELDTSGRAPASPVHRPADTIEGSTLRAGPPTPTPTPTPAAVTPGVRVETSVARPRSTWTAPLFTTLLVALAAGGLVWHYGRADEATARLAAARLESVVAMATAASGPTTGAPVGFATIEALHRSAGDDLTLLLAAADAYGRLSTSMQGSRDGPRWAIVAAQNAVNLLEYLDGRGAAAPAVLERLADAQLLLAEQQLRQGRVPAAARTLATAEQTIERLAADRRSTRLARAAALRGRLP